MGAPDSSVCQAEGEEATEMSSQGEGPNGHPKLGGGLAVAAQPQIYQPLP